MTGEEIVTRARSAIGHATKYELGRGGFDPARPHPWDSKGRCDCTGFYAWCCGVPREVRQWHPWRKLGYSSGWIETTMLYREAREGPALMTAPWDQARPGDGLVYPDDCSGGARRQGHVGIVSVVSPAGPTHVIHCSKRAFLTDGDAISETEPDVFARRGALVIRLRGAGGTA